MAKDTLSGLLSPIDSKSQIYKSEVPSGQEPDLGGQETSLGRYTVHHGASDLESGLLLSNLVTAPFGAYELANSGDNTYERFHRNAIKNPDFFKGTIDLPNYDATALRGNTLKDLYNARQGVADLTLQQTRRIQDQTSANEPTLQLKDLTPNGVGRFQLMSKLEDQFGPGWRANTQAQTILKSFDDYLFQNQDLNALSGLINQGKRVEDYLSSQEILKPAQDYEIQIN